MPSREPRIPKKTQTKDQVVAEKAKEAAGKRKEQRIDNTGLTSRVLGHVASRQRRNQAKRDSR